MSLTGKPQLTTNEPIPNNGFWPRLIVDELLSRYRIPSEYADDVIRHGLLLSMINVNEALLPAQRAIDVMGYATLESFALDNDDIVDDQRVSIVRYKHAVFSRAKAFLLQQFNTLNRRAQAENAGKEAPETEQYWLDQSQAEIHYFFQRFVPDHGTPARYGFHAALI